MGKLVIIPIGIIMVFASPFVLWSAESQNRAKDFESAKEVSADSDEEGYILIKGDVSTDSTLDCPGEKNGERGSCVYVAYSVEEYQRKEEKVCSNTKPSGTILEELKSECDSNGQNCKPCYQVENFEWVTIESKSNAVEFMVGDYTIPSVTKANIQGTSTHEEYIPVSSTSSKSTNDADDLVDEYLGYDDYDTSEEDPYYSVFDQEKSSSSKSTTNSVANPKVGDRKIEYKYIEEGEELVIAGDAKDGEIFKKDKTFVVSADSYSETLTSLKSQDSSAKWGLRIVSLFLMVAGFMAIAGGIASIPLALVNVIPIVGDNISGAMKSAISFVAGMIGGVLWVVTFIIITALKNIVALGIVFGILALIGAGVYYYINMKKQQGLANDVAK